MARLASDCSALRAALVPVPADAAALVPAADCCGWSDGCIAVVCGAGDGRSGPIVTGVVTVRRQQDQQGGVCRARRLTEHIGAVAGLEAIDLGAAALIGRIPHSIGDLRRLKVLHLDHNHLYGDVPASLDRLRDLASLNLDGNQLVGKLPASLWHLQETADSGRPLMPLGPILPDFVPTPAPEMRVFQRAIATTIAQTPSPQASPSASPVATNVREIRSLTNALVSCFIVLAFVIAITVSAVRHFRKHEMPRLIELHRQHSIARLKHDLHGDDSDDEHSERVEMMGGQQQQQQPAAAAAAASRPAARA